ncbi:putative 3-oxoadipate enol-lactonase [Nitrospira japonica]|uniref:Putative 3-oxoadipate enol-lactonase n=1 Tax=Nitrospira japonica TaxID=1325564 RepID=A0A1W1IAG8_9BACT|nr:alpha/beta hydrolase [Nitrospira japonica]SLM49911.1 putative 3-oxoadipate enol-lactonase [Nitrospira japonica]
MPVVHVVGSGTALHYRESGDPDNPTIVFAHPLIWGGDSFGELLAGLTDEFHVVTVDIHGHGLSGYRETMTLEEMTEDFYHVLQSLHVPKVSWLGYSIGGMIGMRLAIAHPDVLDSLVLVATTARPDPSTIKAATFHLWKMFRDGHRKDIVDSAMKFFFADRTYREQPELIAKCRAKFVGITDAQGMFAAALAAFNRFDIGSQIRRIATPTLVIAGREDPAATPALADSIAAQIPKAKLEIVEGTSHLVGIEKPLEVTALVRGFLRTSTQVN